MKNERISYFDGLKAICIMLVVYAHTAFISNDSIVGNFLTTITWSAVPIFMMISGGLLHRKKDFDIKKYAIKITKMYFVLCLWKLLYLIYGILFNNVRYGILECVQYTFLFLDMPGVSYSHTWYMVAYLIVMFLYPITHFLFNCENKKVGRLLLMYIALLCLFTGIAIHDLDWWFGKFLNVLSISKLPIVGINEIFPFINYSNMIFYFILGAFLYEYRETISKIIHKYRYLLFVAFFLSLSVLILMKYIELGVFTWNNEYLSIGYNRLGTIIMAVSLYLIFYEYRKELSLFNNSIGKLIGRNTLGIYYLHSLIISIVNALFGTFIQNNLSVLFSIVSSTLITALCTGLTILIKKTPYINQIVK